MSDREIAESRLDPGTSRKAGTTTKFPRRPGLVLIDGGADSSLWRRRGAARDLGIDRHSAGRRRQGVRIRDAGREHFHFPGRDKPLMLEPRDPVLYFVQRLRDEAHRFAIGTHRAKRSKAIGANPLDEIAGIGPTRKRALLKHFGSAKAVSRASPETCRRSPASARKWRRPSTISSTSGGELASADTCVAGHAAFSMHGRRPPH